MRVIAYIDGMNFYEASKNHSWYPAGWCNWTETIRAYCPGAVVSVRYFTSKYIGGDRKRKRRQDLHLMAMEQEAKAELVYGSCRLRRSRCPKCAAQSQRVAEKMTDVNIAVRLLEDAVDSLFDHAYLVSSDIDLVPAVHAALRRAPESQIRVLLPPGAVKAEEFSNLERLYPDRSSTEYLDLSRIRRFPDDLPRRWNRRLPAHWREDAGARPDHPEQETTLPRTQTVSSWAKESAGYGTEAATQALPNIRAHRAKA
jgi:uncharacterized LabA/DUF88 family protein